MKYTHTGLVTRSDTGAVERIKLRETKKCWTNGFSAWRKSSKEPRCRDQLWSGVPRYLTLDLSSIRPFTREDLRQPYLDSVEFAKKSLQEAQACLAWFDSKEGKE